LIGFVNKQNEAKTTFLPGVGKRAIFFDFDGGGAGWELCCSMYYC
jgi:hypothetical protein